MKSTDIILIIPVIVTTCRALFLQTCVSMKQMHKYISIKSITYIIVRYCNTSYLIIKKYTSIWVFNPINSHYKDFS